MSRSGIDGFCIINIVVVIDFIRLVLLRGRKGTAMSIIVIPPRRLPDVHELRGWKNVLPGEFSWSTSRGRGSSRRSSSSSSI
eukprot:scaffold7586_cov174-Amphora_coffeaeformis.AAC.4